MSKNFLSFEYNENNLLSAVVNHETKDVIKLNYAKDNNRVKQLIGGKLNDTAISAGSKDFDNNDISACGVISCGLLSSNNVIIKSEKRFEYFLHSFTDTVAYRVNITNVTLGLEDSSATLAYFIDNDGKIISNFEKVGDCLKTLNRQGAKRTGQFTPYSDSKKINGQSSSQVFGNAAFTFNGGISRSKSEENDWCFEYAFWLKLSSAYELAEMKLTYQFADEASQVETVYIDGAAYDGWQRVSIPIVVPSNDDGKPDTKRSLIMKLQLLSNKQNCSDSFIINEIGFTPAPNTKLQFHTETNQYLPLQKSTQVMLQTGDGMINKFFDKNFYFTENDIIATYANKYAHTYINEEYVYFDIICNNGSKRIANVRDIRFCFVSDTGATFRIQTKLPAGNVINTYYTFTESTVTTQTVGIIEEGKTSSTATILDFRGKTLLEADEYGIEKHYYYDEFGVLIKLEETDSDGTVGSISRYAYDSEGRPLTTDNGFTGQAFVYDDFDQIKSLTECRVDLYNDSLKQTEHKIENKYGAFRDKQIASVESCGEGSVVCQRKVTYKDGQVRSVTDGTVKYGVKENFEKNEVEYTQFESADSENETVLQKDSVSNYRKTDSDIVVRRHTSEFTVGTNQTQYVSGDVDMYGHLRTIYRSGTVNAKYRYSYDDALNESKYASKVKECCNADNEDKTIYNYDIDGNLIGWQDKLTSFIKPLTFTVRQVSDNSVKYTFGDREDYFAVTEYDTEKTLSPRITGIQYMFDNNQSYDTPYNLTLFKRSYQYDAFGRILSKDNDTFFRQKYEYCRKGSASLLTKSEFKNYDEDQEHLIGLPFVHQTESVEYDDGAQIKSVKKNISWSSFAEFNQTTDVKFDVKKTFKYDRLRRLTHETDNAFGIDKTYSYNVQGKLQKILLNGTGEAVTYHYNNKGQLSAVSSGSRYTPYAYDTYGNRVSKVSMGEATTYTYNYGNTLVKVADKNGVSNYEYNVEGVRFRKTCGDVITQYYLDGNRILGEDRLSQENPAKEIRYFYDAEGLMGFRYNNSDYLYVKDVFNNISMILYRDKRVCARYEYDVWGNCKVYDENGNINTNPLFVGNINPFRWKSFYYDAETELYYANGSYYDKETGLYLDASPIANVFDDVYLTKYIDRNGLLCDNIFELTGNPYTIDFVAKLHPDPTYDSEDGLPWWLVARNWMHKAMYDVADWFGNLHWAIKLSVGLVLLAAAIIFTVATGGGSAGVLGLLVQVAIGVGIGVGMYALGALFAGTFSWSGLAAAALDAFLITSAVVFISAGVNALKTGLRKPKINIEQELKTRAETYRQSLNSELPGQKLDELQFATVTYDSKLGTYSYAYNSEIVGMTDDMLNATLRGMRAKTSCAEIQAVNKALNSGSKLSNLHIYTINTQTGSAAYACRVCSRVLNGKVAAIYTGLFPGF